MLVEDDVHQVSAVGAEQDGFSREILLLQYNSQCDHFFNMSQSLSSEVHFYSAKFLKIHLEMEWVDLWQLL